MTEQQLKTKKLFTDIGTITGRRILCIIGAGGCSIFMIIQALLPVPWLYAGRMEPSFFMLTGLGAIGVGWTYLSYYRMYNLNQSREKILNTIKYLPVDLKDVRYVKLRGLCKVYGIITLICLVAQVIGCIIAQMNFTWINVAGVLLQCALPLAFNAITVYLEK